ncbi:unnamed protein product [Cylindrotheca closterium]|uniref:Uncharacterized protein n=1 Tax=Cylindrotheca closterium TaxID=2856 RepID=A0AAD2G2M1_9STRA|nr:unnamed protein product [Cylindrotheca closterium]
MSFASSILLLCCLAFFAEPGEAFQSSSWKAQCSNLRIQPPATNVALPSKQSICSTAATTIPVTRCYYYSTDSSADGDSSQQATIRQNDSHLQSSIIAHDWQTGSGSSTFLQLSSSPMPSPFPLASEIQFRSKPSSLKTSQQEEYQKRIQDWADLYTSVEGLRNHFGRNANRLWGDLDAVTARRIYQTLLPTALLWLAQTGVQPQDLAPLAYQARKAAKLYIRERSQLPARVGAHLIDGIRQFRKHGKFQTQGMTYEQIWQKYRKVIMDEQNIEEFPSSDSLEEEDVVVQICYKILEKSCTTNSYIDELFASSNDEGLGKELQQISAILETDVHRLLDPVVGIPFPSAVVNMPTASATKNTSQEQRHLIRRYHMLKRIARVKQRLLLQHRSKKHKAATVHT